jgi:hypothetical protein
MAVATLTVKDETATGDMINSFPLEFPTERITVRELIRERVYQEVQDYNRRRPDVFRGLVQPTDAEQQLNGYQFKLRHTREIDWKKQFEKACDAFDRNGFFVLIGDHQAERLDEEVLIGREQEATFVKLVPLVGG